MRKILKLERGGTTPRFLDILTALILLAILACVAYLQFPVYSSPARAKLGSNSTRQLRIS
ncbi:MAG TPA: hypothetical protein VMU16_06160 [Candidatus Binataceae bacterium]|nr:hypothetical protein [Candidatus Binataceae bacterium]